MSLSIGTVKIEYLGGEDYPPPAAVKFIQHLREKSFDTWRVESDGNVFLELERRATEEKLYDYFRGGAAGAKADGETGRRLNDRTVSEVQTWLDRLFAESDIVMVHTSS